jgi:hypothetical protein
MGEQRAEVLTPETFTCAGGGDGLGVGKGGAEVFFAAAEVGSFSPIVSRGLLKRPGFSGSRI